MPKSVSLFSLCLKYFWVNLFYILPAVFVFCIPNFFSSIHRFLMDSILPFCLGNILSFLWEIWRLRKQAAHGAEGEGLQPPLSDFWNNLYYLFPVCLMNASIAVFEICLLSAEEWQKGHMGKNLLYLSLLFCLFLVVNGILAYFFSWLMRAFASNLWKIIHHSSDAPAFIRDSTQKKRIFGGFPAASVRQTFYALSHPDRFLGKLFWYWLRLNLIFFMPAAIGIGLGWLCFAEDLVTSRYFLPIELILWGYINLLAILGGIGWFFANALLEENAGSFLKNLKAGIFGHFLYWLLKANLIAVMPVLFLLLMGKNLPDSLAVLDPARQSVRIIPPSFWIDFLCANLALTPVGLIKSCLKKSENEREKAAPLQ